MAFQVMISLLLLSPSFLSQEEKQISCVPTLWSCDGEVLVDGQQVECSPDVGLLLKPRMTVVAEKGAAVVMDEFCQDQAIGRDRKRKEFRVREPRSSDESRWERILSLFEEVLGGRSIEAILKGDGDEFPALTRPRIDFLSGDGPALANWEGLVAWRNLPPGRPIVVRALQDERIIYGPAPLIEPILDLSVFQEASPSKVHLELLVLQGTPLPGESTLREPIRLLLSRPGNLLLGALSSTLYIEPEDDRAAALAVLQAHEGEPARLQAVAAMKAGRLERARRALREEADQLWSPLERALSGVNIFGSSLAREAAKAPRRCDATTDADRVWECFWQELGSSVVPEIPLADLDAAKRLSDFLLEGEPGGWRSLVAQAQIDFLLGRHRDARDKLQRAKVRCRSDRCSGTITALELSVLIDAYSDFERVALLDVLLLAEPNYMELQSKARKGLSKADPATVDAALIWYAASYVRITRSLVSSLRRMDLPSIRMPRMQPDKVRSLYRNMAIVPLPKTPASSLLEWSIYPSEPPPRLPYSIRPAAALLHADAMIAPHGGVGNVDVSTDEPVHNAVFYTVGARPASAAPLQEDLFKKVMAELVGERGPSGTNLLAVRRLAVQSFGQAALGRHEEARTTFGAAEALFPAGTRPLESSSLDLLRASVLLEEGKVAEARTLLDRSVRTAIESGSPGRAANIFATWATFARNLFYLENRYADGLGLMRRASEQATKEYDSENPQESASILLQAAELIVEPLNMLDRLNFYPEIVDLLPASREQAKKLKKLRDELMARAHEIAPDNGSYEQLKEKINVEFLQIEIESLEARAWAKLADKRRFEESLVKLSNGFGEFGRKMSDALESSYTILLLYAQGQIQEAERLILEKGDWEQKGTIRLIREGNLGVLDRFETELRSLDQELSRRNLGSAHWMYRQSLINQRGSYIRLCSQVQSARQARREFERWQEDLLSKSLALQQRWRKLLLSAQVLEAEGRADEARRVYGKSVEYFRSSVTRQQRSRLDSFVWAQEDAYLGSGRLEMELGSQEGVLKALDRLDELRWVESKTTTGDLSESGIPKLGDLDNIRRGLGPDGAIVVLGRLARQPRQYEVWLASRKGLQAKRFRLQPDEPDLREAIHAAGRGQRISAPALAEISAWLDAHIPPDAPLALVLDSEYRGLGAHLLPVGDTPLALRNPLTVVPSLRVLEHAQKRINTGTGRSVVGMPLIPEAANRPLVSASPWADEDELRQLGAVGQSNSIWMEFRWNREATVDELSRILGERARVHISAHGRSNSIRLKETGIELYRDIFNLEHARQVSLPGSLIVLSSCSSGAWKNSRLGMVATLDLAFLSAGASNVVSTPWWVDSKPAGVWMKWFHAGLNSGKSPMEAARTAYRETRKEHPDPTQWGAFTLVGSGVGSF